MAITKRTTKKTVAAATETPVTTVETSKKSIVPAKAAALRLIPHVTEKGMSQSSAGVYVFKTVRAIEKTAVKRFLERTYRVQITDIRVLNVKGKAVRRGKIADHAKKFWI